MFKYWKLSTISMVMSMAPIVTVAFGILLVGETVNRSDVLQMILSLVAVFFIMLNSIQDKEELSKGAEKSIEEDSINYARRDHLSLFPLLLLLANPVLLAMHNILLRMMKKLKSETLSCYVNPAVGLAGFLGLWIL